MASFAYSPTWFMYEVIRPDDDPGMHRCTTEIPILMKRHTFCSSFYAYSRNFDTVRAPPGQGGGGGPTASAARARQRSSAPLGDAPRPPAPPCPNSALLAVLVLDNGAQPEAGQL